VIVPFFRGQVTLFSYLGYRNGIRVVASVTNEEYQRIMSDTKVSLSIKKSLESLNSAKKIMYVVEKSSIPYIYSSYVFHNFKCTDIGNAGGSIFFQNFYYYENIELFACEKKLSK
jgi:hypothetical protein